MIIIAILSSAFKKEYTKIGTAFKQLAMTFNIDNSEGKYISQFDDTMKFYFILPV